MPGPSARDFFRNFDDYDGSLEKKIRKTLTNNAKKLVTLSECCGHPGEPGCWKKAEPSRAGGHQHPHPHRHESSTADELHELKHRLAELNAAVDALLARHQAEEPPAVEGDPPLTSPS